MKNVTLKRKTNLTNLKNASAGTELNITLNKNVNITLINILIKSDMAFKSTYNRAFNFFSSSIVVCLTRMLYSE